MRELLYFSTHLSSSCHSIYADLRAQPDPRGWARDSEGDLLYILGYWVTPLGIVSRPRHRVHDSCFDYLSSIVFGWRNCRGTPVKGLTTSNYYYFVYFYTSLLSPLKQSEDSFGIPRMRYPNLPGHLMIKISQHNRIPVYLRRSKLRNGQARIWVRHK